MSIYSKVVVPILSLAERCSAVEAENWITPDEESYFKYPVKIFGSEAQIYQHPVILKPDGTIWLDGSLFLLQLAIDESTDNGTLKSMAGDLVHFMNKMDEHDLDYRDFGGRKLDTRNDFLGYCLPSGQG